MDGGGGGEKATAAMRCTKKPECLGFKAMYLYMVFFFASGLDGSMSDTGKDLYWHSTF